MNVQEGTRVVYGVPKSIVFVKNLPYIISGEIMKTELHMMYGLTRIMIERQIKRSP